MPLTRSVAQKTRRSIESLDGSVRREVGIVDQVGGTNVIEW
jgi:hypothetical protein